MIYLDASALVKRYVDEDGSDRVNGILSETSLCATSKLTWPEILSALQRKRRAGEISAAWLKKASDAFERDWDRFAVLEMADDLLPLVKRLIGKHGIRGADSVHLASASWLGTAIRDTVTFVSSDVRLLEAAGKEKLLPLDPRTGRLERG